MASVLSILATITCSAQSGIHSPRNLIDSLEDRLDLPLEDVQKIEILDQLADLYNVNSSEKVIEYRGIAFALCAQKADSACMAHQAYQAIYHLINTGHFDLAGQYLEFTSLYFKDRDPGTYARVMTRYGFFYDRLSEFQNALLSYLKANSIYQTIHDTAGLADISVRLGLIFYQLNNYNKALEYFKSLILSCEEQNICRSYRTGLFYCGRIYTETGDYVRAIPVLEKYLRLQEDSVNIRPRAFAEWSRAMLAISHNQPDLALAHLKSARTLFESIQLYGDVSNMYLTMGDLIRRTSAHDAILMYQNALTNAMQIRGNTVVMKAHQKLSDCYATQGDHAEAFEHLQKYQRLYEERNIGLEARLAEQNLAYTSQQYDQNIALLNTQQQVAELMAKRQQAQRNGLIGISVLLLIVAIVFYYQLRQNRKARQLLVDKNAIIDQSLSEKEDLLREIHHRVKNNLQIVSSMLHLQGRHIKDPAVLEALRDSRNRVNSMALIHQSLYKEEHLKGINVRDYIHALTQSLKTSYRIDDERIQITTDVESMLLDVDSAIPIGLITNELLTNAIKYAFAGRDHGVILVSLKRAREHLDLVVEDNGVGMPPDFQSRTQESYGYHLIHSLARKLKADVEINNTSGCSVHLRIQQYKLLHI